MSALRLRPLRVSDEVVVRAAHEEMEASDGFPFLLGWDPTRPWAAHVELVAARRRGERLKPDWVRDAFLVADVGGEVVGRTSIRFELNEFLREEGGHIGYGVLPAHRRRGHATEILRQALVVARSEGVDDVLVICDDDNVGSATVIERCGGVLDGVVGRGPDAPPLRRYWIGA